MLVTNTITIYNLSVLYFFNIVRKTYYVEFHFRIEHNKIVKVGSGNFKASSKINKCIETFILFCYSRDTQVFVFKICVLNIFEKKYSSGQWTSILSGINRNLV